MSNVRYNQVRSGDRHGNSTKVQIFSGSSNSGDFGTFDANGNLVATPASSVIAHTGPFLTLDGTTYAPVWPITDPNLISWTQLNFGASTLDTTYGRHVIPEQGTTELRCEYTSLPSGGTVAWTVTALVDAFSSNNGGQAAGDQTAGIFIRNSASGKIIAISLDEQTGEQFRILQWTDPSTFSTSRNNGYIGVRRPAWMRITDNLTTITYQVSADSVHWSTLLNTTDNHSTGFMGVADTVGWFTRQKTIANVPFDGTLYSFAVTTP